MGFTKLWVISKNLLPKKVLLPLPATCCQSLDHFTVNSNIHVEYDTRHQQPAAMPMKSIEVSGTRHLGCTHGITSGLKRNIPL